MGAFLLTAAALLALLLWAVNTGSLHVTPAQLLRGLFVEYDPNVATVYDLRFPRIFIALFGAVLSFATPNFLTAYNVGVIFKQMSFFGVAALGQTLVLIIGGIDLSIG